MPNPEATTESADAARLVLCTFPSPEKAAEVARTVVGEHLAACANLVPTVRSIYTWQGAVQDETETLAILKTSAARFDALARRLVELHPYEVPEVIAMPITDAHAPYLAWVVAATAAGLRSD
jgi:periplasmic divalent cation tolerance protein